MLISLFGDLDAATKAELSRHDELVVAKDRAGAASILDNRAAELDIAILRSPHTLRSDQIDKCTRLRAVIRAGTGTDNIDFEALKARRIQFFTTPEAAPAVAELAFGLLLAVARQISVLHRDIVAGGWSKWSTCGIELQERCLGVFGYGRIGRRVGAIGRAFGMRVIACSRAHRSHEIPYDAELVQFEELTSLADVIVVCAPLLPSTRELFGRETFGRMRRGSILVNVARGEIVDTEALLDALDDGQIYGAGLDAVAGEPVIPGRLRDHPRVVITPHVGAQTRETQLRIGTSVVRIVEGLRAADDESHGE